MHKVALVQVSLRVLWYSLVSIIPPMLHAVLSSGIKKVKFVVEQATKAQRESTSIALLFL